MNKAELIDALAERIGDKKTAGAAVDGLVDIVVRAVSKGDKVTISGFGVFEKRARAARTARNPRTGEAVKVKKTSVPAFRPGMNFKEVVSGAKKLPKATTSARMGAGTAPTTRSTTSRPTPAKPMASKLAASKPAASRSKPVGAGAGAKVSARVSVKTADRTAAAAAKDTAKSVVKKAAGKASNRKKSRGVRVDS